MIRSRIAPYVPCACALILAIALLLVAPAARAEDITFQVRMSQQVALGIFDPATDFVDLAGTFNDWGTNPLTPLADADGDTVYHITLSGFTPGEYIEYKFRINGLWDGTEEFPGVGSNRIYTVLEGENLIDVWYNDLEPGGGEPDPSQLSWWNDTVFYEIFVRSFYDSDGDGIGDLPGLTSKLDYLNDGDPATDTDLGITGIWLMPINDSPSYHGYDSTDYRDINPDYGTMADFEAFLAAAHARGIKVIVDYVMNHCSNLHPWFVASRANDPEYRDWFRWSDTNPGDNWHWDESGWYYGLFWSGMPDLNYDNPAVKAEMFDTATWWLDTVGVDGFRLDAVLYIDEDSGQYQTTAGTLAFWQDYNAHVKSVNPDMMSVGEAWTNTSTVLQYVTDDRLDICFEFDLSYSMLNAVNGGDAAGVNSKASTVYNNYPYLQYATFLTNHDQDRSFSVLGEDTDKAKAAAGLYLTLPGVPFLYYGEEIGMIGTGDHRYIRSPMQWDTSAYSGFSLVEPWQALNGNYLTWNVLVENGDPDSLLNWYRTLIHTRNGNSALRSGTHAPVISSNSPVMAFVRRDDDQTLLCLVNTSDRTQRNLVLSGLQGSLEPRQYDAHELLADTWGALEVTNDSEITGLQLDAYEVRVYDLVSVTAADDVPTRTGLRLEQNHPNPFNPTTTLRYALPGPSHVRIGVYDVAGREVAVLADGPRDAGPQTVNWNGTDAAGQSVGAGVYFARLESEHGVESAKMTLLK